MATSSKKSASQSDLRKLMRERRNELIVKGKKQIDSPLAKYNNSGQLTCIVCEESLKSEALWSTHITGKVHKEKLEILKRKQLNSEKYLKTDIKRKHEDSEIEKKETKKNFAKLTEESADDSNRITDVNNKVKSSTPCIEEDVLEKKETTIVESIERLDNLPKDFFDDSSKEILPANVTTNELNKKNSNELPEGFFDNPILDAKVRKVEYKDPMEEEWEKFKKIMAEESNVSQAIIEEDMQESNVERDITEIDEQIHRWSRVEALQERRDHLKRKEEEGRDEAAEEGSGDDRADFEEFPDWRSKRAYRH